MSWISMVWSTMQFMQVIASMVRPHELLFVDFTQSEPLLLLESVLSISVNFLLMMLYSSLGIIYILLCYVYQISWRCWHQLLSVLLCILNLRYLRSLSFCLGYKIIISLIYFRVWKIMKVKQKDQIAQAYDKKIIIVFSFSDKAYV